MTGNMKQPDPELLEREERVIQLRKTGATWAMVGKALGYASGSGAYKAYQRSAERRVFPLIDEYREIEVELLDSLLFQLFHDDEGKPKKRLTLREMDRALAIHDRKVKLLGLSAPEKLQAEVITYDNNNIAESHRRFMELFATTQQTQGGLAIPTSTT
jgi:hypothetical protein